MAARQKYGDHSASPNRKRRRRSDSGDRSGSNAGHRGVKGALPMGGYSPGMFPPMWMGGKGVLPFGDWFQGLSAEGGKSGGGGEGAMPPMPAGFAPGMFPPVWGWPGMPPVEGSWNGRASRDDDDDRRARTCRREHSGDRSRDRGDRSRSGGRGKSVDYLRLPRQIMGRVIGKSGSTINGIRESSGARIDAEDKDDEQCEFRIQGTPEAVERAKSMILEVVEKSSAGPGGRSDSWGGGSGTGACSGGGDDSNTTSDTLEFPVSLMGGIIGARGSKISDVRQQSGARVQVEKGDGRCKVTISGLPEQVERARNMVKHLAEEELGSEAARGGQPRGDSWGVDRGNVGGNAVTNNLEFPVAATGRIIGSRGAQISDVRQQSGARVSVEKLDDCCRVQISGTPEQVDRARKMVVALSDEGQGPRRSEANDQMEVPLSMVGRVIGKGGDTIQRLQRESGARLDVNTNEGDPCVVRISGSRDACSRARFLIAEVLDRGLQHSERPGARQQGSSTGQGYWGPGPDSGAPWGPLPPFGGLPPPGDGNGAQWHPPWGPPMQMPGMWGVAPGAKGGCAPPVAWDYPYGGSGCHGPERDRERECDRSRASEQPQEASGLREEKPRREIDLDEL